MKKRKIVACAMVAMLLLAGCGKQEQMVVVDEVVPAKVASVQATPIVEEEKSIADIYAEIQNDVTLYSPMEFDDEFLMNYYGIDASLLEEYVFSMSEDATSAETIVVMKAKQQEDVEMLSELMQVVVEEKKNEMENYLPEQFAIVEKAEVETKGCYLWLVISENEQSIKKMIEDGLK